MRFPRQEYWSELPVVSLGDLLNPGIEPGSPALQADALTTEPPGKRTFLWITTCGQDPEQRHFSLPFRQRGRLRHDIMYKHYPFSEQK